jgi:nicotinate phosphoribosyltransferase
MIYDERLGIGENPMIADPADSLRRKKIEPHTNHEDLLVPVMRQGKCVYKIPEIHDIRKRTQQQLASVHKGVRRLLNPHQYPAGIELGLCELRNQLILETRQLV